MKKSELSVITSAKKLFSYITEITAKSPVKFRYSFVTKMHNLGMEIIENLYYANGISLGDNRRIDYQNKAMVKLKLLDYICEASKDVTCITMHQYDYISKEILSTLNLLNGWMNSDLKRIEEKKV